MDNTFGLIFGIFLSILLYSAPLIVTALGGMFSEKSGVVNIGLEGIMTFSAFMTMIGILLIESQGINGPIALTAGVLFGILGGVIFATLHAILTVKYNVDQIISGTAINIVGLGLAISLTNFLFGQKSTPFKSSYSIELFGIPLIVILIILLVFISYFILEKTRWGLHVKACGENPKSAQSVGINVERTRIVAVVLSGVFGAIGGSAVVILTSGSFSATTISGLGYIALAVLIFGQWRPLGVLFSGLLFGTFTTLGIKVNTLLGGQIGLSPMFLSISLILLIIFLTIGIFFLKKKILNIIIILLIYIMTINLIYTQFNINAGISIYYDILPYIMTIVALIYYSNEKKQPTALGEPFEASGI